MRLEISTPNKTLFEGDVKSVQCQGKDGFFQILENHAPMIAVIVNGKIKYQLYDDPAFHYIESTRGMLEVRNNKVIILMG